MSRCVTFFLSPFRLFQLPSSFGETCGRSNRVTLNLNNMWLSFFTSPSFFPFIFSGSWVNCRALMSILSYPTGLLSFDSSQKSFLSPLLNAFVRAAWALCPPCRFQYPPPFVFLRTLSLPRLISDSLSHVEAPPFLSFPFFFETFSRFHPSRRLILPFSPLPSA